MIQNPDFEEAGMAEMFASILMLFNRATI